MNGSDLDLTEMVCARLCHDLAGPLGAVASGVDLLGDDPDPEIARMVAATAAGAVARLRLLRAALGTAGAPRTEADSRALVQAYLDSGSSALAPVELDWTGRGADLAGDAGRLVLSLVMVARESLPRGGRVSVDLDGPSPGAGLGLAVGFHGPSARLDPDSREVLGDAVRPSGPRSALAWWVSKLAARAGGAIVVEDQADGGWIRA